MVMRLLVLAVFVTSFTAPPEVEAKGRTLTRRVAKTQARLLRWLRRGNWTARALDRDTSKLNERTTVLQRNGRAHVVERLPDRRVVETVFFKAHKLDPKDNDVSPLVRLEYHLGKASATASIKPLRGVRERRDFIIQRAEGHILAQQTHVPHGARGSALSYDPSTGRAKVRIGKKMTDVALDPGLGRAGLVRVLDFAIDKATIQLHPFAGLSL